MITGEVWEVENGYSDLDEQLAIAEKRVLEARVGLTMAVEGYKDIKERWAIKKLKERGVNLGWKSYKRGAIVDVTFTEGVKERKITGVSPDKIRMVRRLKSGRWSTCDEHYPHSIIQWITPHIEPEKSKK